MFIPPNEVTIILRVVIAALLGLIIGLQRERRKVMHHDYGAAGLRTHAIVALGAALITAAGILSFPIDPIRIAASIMTGIGFIGAGTIIATQARIRGLTTAASVWTAAAIGITSGIGLFASAIAATVIIVLLLELSRFEKIE